MPTYPFLLPLNFSPWVGAGQSQNGHPAFFNPSTYQGEIDQNLRYFLDIEITAGLLHHTITDCSMPALFL
jgi:hypothetical protein